MRKLTRRLGHQVVDGCIRGVIGVALAERRFRPRALRSDATVAEADIRYPPTPAWPPTRCGSLPAPPAGSGPR